MLETDGPACDRHGRTATVEGGGQQAYLRQWRVELLPGRDYIKKSWKGSQRRLQMADSKSSIKASQVSLPAGPDGEQAGLGLDLDIGAPQTAGWGVAQGWAVSGATCWAEA